MRCSFRPSASITQMFLLRSKAIRFPSGDQAGPQSLRPLVDSWSFPSSSEIREIAGWDDEDRAAVGDAAPRKGPRPRSAA